MSIKTFFSGLFSTATVKAAETAVTTEAQKLANTILSNANVRSEVQGTIHYLETQALAGLDKLDKAAVAAIPTIAAHIPVLGEVSKSVAILVVQTLYNDVKGGIVAEVRKLLARLGL